MNIAFSFIGTFLMVLLVAFTVSLAFSPVAIKLAPKIGAVDIPKDNRRMHTKAMPRFGGLAIFAGTMTAMALAMTVFLPYLRDTWPQYWEGMGLTEPVEKITGILAGGILIYLVGVVDDLKGMPAKVKFLCQVGCAVVAYYFGIRISFFTNHFGGGLTGGFLQSIVSFGEEYAFVGDFFGFLVTVLWIVGITNTINLIDGLDGLAAGVAAIASLGIGYTTYIHGMYTATMAMLAIAGGALGFLPFNFHPAKIFMGDGGSLFLGYTLATVSIIGPAKGATVVAMAVPVLVLAVPIFDTAFAILRRLVNKRPIMEADKGHLHHRLMAAGLGQTRSVLMLYGISGVVAVAAILFSRDLFLECLGLFVIAADFIYIFLTDSNSRLIQIRTIKEEKAALEKGKTAVKSAEKSDEALNGAASAEKQEEEKEESKEARGSEEMEFL